MQVNKMQLQMQVSESKGTPQESLVVLLLTYERSRGLIYSLGRSSAAGLAWNPERGAGFELRYLEFPLKAFHIARRRSTTTASSDLICNVLLQE